MDLAFIEGLVALVARSGLGELEYSEGTTRIRIVASATGGPVATVDTVAMVATGPVAVPLPAGPERHVVKAGLVGVFYRAASPGNPPFVQVGDIVAEGQTLGIVEAMKLFNPVEADRAGTVIEILVGDGEAVAMGTPLLILGPAGAEA